MQEAMSVPSVKPLQQEVVERVFREDTSATQPRTGSNSEVPEPSPNDAAKPEPSALLRTRLSFSIDRETGNMSIQVIDTETDEVIRQIPPEEFVRIATRLAKMVGLLFDHRT